jgi:malate dehydrogenase
VMTYLAYKQTGLDRHRIFGMGVSLDTARFVNLMAKKLSVSTTKIEALVIGSHGETMLPLPRFSKVEGKPLTEILKASEVEELVKATKLRGAEIVSLYGSGSAYYAPAAAIHQIAQAILSGKSQDIPVCAVLDGEFGLKDVAIGVPAKIGSRGIEKILEIDLNAQERDALATSARSIQDAAKLLVTA